MRFTSFTPSNTAIFLCDMQERFRSRITHFDHIARMSEKLLTAADLLEIPTFATEQNPKGLGSTIEPLAKFCKDATFPKSRFSMLIPEIKDQLRHRQIQHVAVVGIETHICVLQTCLDLLRNEINVHVMADGVSSCNMGERGIALQTIRDAGGAVTTTESFIFEILGDANHLKAKSIFELVKLHSDSTKEAVGALCL